MAAGERFAEVLDHHLIRNEFANGPHFSMADICLGVIAHRWLGLPEIREPRPNLERWFRTVSEREAARSLLVLPLQ